MASFFDNLAFVMGGQDQITPAAQAAYGDYNAMTTKTSAAQSVAADGGGSTAPVVSQQNGLFGLLGSGLGGQQFDYTGGGSSIVAGPGSDLYGGDINLNTGQSAYSSIIPSASMYGGPKDGASNLSAAVQRAQYQDYMNRFAPIENFAVGQVQGRNTKDLGYDVARANQTVANAGANLQAQQGRAMGRFGLQYKGPSIAGSADVAGGQVAAMNQARLADEARTLDLIGGSAGGGNG